MTTTARRARPALPVIVYAPGPDDPLDAETVAAMLGICEDSAYKLARLVRSYEVPGVGRRWRRGDVLAYLYQPKHATEPAATCQAKPKKPRGTRRASDARGEKIPGTDDTEADLRERNGYR